MRIEVDPETHALNQQASMAGMVFLVGGGVVRYGAWKIAGCIGT